MVEASVFQHYNENVLYQRLKPPKMMPQPIGIMGLSMVFLVPLGFLIVLLLNSNIFRNFGAEKRSRASLHDSGGHASDFEVSVPWVGES